MHVLILMGSPRPACNTAELCKPVIDELQTRGATVSYLPLCDKRIAPCLGCYRCQDINGDYGCVQQDDMQAVVRELCKADAVVLATPIYSWYCPATMKALLDRTYGMNKFYGTASGTLWNARKQQKLALLLTHGYDAAYATEPFVTGMQRFAAHCHLAYAGAYTVRDMDDLSDFQTPEAVEGARAFARSLLDG